MNINKVYANVKLAVPDATLIEMNKYLLAEIDTINARGIEGMRKYAVVYPTEESYGSPSDRTDSQTFNYYPDVKCFILPSEVALVEQIYHGTTKLSEMSMVDFVSQTEQVPNAYYLSFNGEIYFYSELTEGDIITVVGSFGGLTADMLPDKYIPALSNAIIAGLVSNEYKDPDAFAIYSRRAAQSQIVTRESIVQTKYTKRNGRLY